MKYKLFLWINQSNGDTLGMIPLIEAIKKTVSRNGHYFWLLS
jgi:hypothetical protein